ncbi:MAG: apolipoprotein N-acyltransferase [Bacteroidales bacterium]|nr:apolipoprotein N-acyltransferase [Bacteroidales bacterium]
MNKYALIALSASGGMVSGLAWTSWCSGLVLLFSFVPFLWIENYFCENPGEYSSASLFFYLFPGFAIFNIITLAWIRVASIPAVIFIVTGLSFLMSFILWLAHLIRVKTGRLVGSLALISFWLAFEYLSLNTTYLSPWINLGNGLAKDILFIQWYDATGVAGGSLWILCSNLLLMLLIEDIAAGRKKSKLLPGIWILVIIIPSAVSLIRFKTIEVTGNSKTEVVIIQPNSDPYTEKFTVPFEIQLNDALRLAEQNITEETDWVISPETTVDDPVSEEYVGENKYVMMVRQFAKKHPGTCIVIGMVSSVKDSTMSFGLAANADTADHVLKYYNSAFRIDTGARPDIYHKSKLVAGIEMQLFSGLQQLLDRMLPGFGNNNRGYDTQEERICFEHQDNKLKIAPVICYESVFGNYVTDYVRNGAEVLFIITNDGWWKNTDGYRQHLSYASLRAIETRRQVARSANTGISCIIDIRGRRTIESEWWTEAVIRGDLYPENRITVYVKYGDYIMLIASFVSIFILTVVFIIIPVRRKLTIAK